MKHFLYNLAIRQYRLGISIASSFNPKAKQWIEGRKNYFKNLPKLNDKKVIWFHCASLGEFDMALPVMNLLKQKYPNIFLLVTFFSPSGMNHYHKRKHQVDLALYLPLDTPDNAKKFLSHFKPEKAFFVKYEFWSNYIFEAEKQQIQVFSICSLFRKEHRFFKWYGGFFRDTLEKIDFFYTQNETSSLLLADIGIRKFITSGDTRYDRVIENKEQLEANVRIEQFLENEKAIIIGSSWEEDENILISYINKNPSLKFILAPHEIDENHLSNIEKKITNDSIRYSVAHQPGNQVLILNTIGHLANAYSYGSIAYVGGGFSGNLHNILEPAVFGLPVIFGPKYKRFPEAEQFIHAGIGFSISSLEELESRMKLIHNNHQQISDNTLDFVSKHKGATSKIVAHLESNFGM